MRQLSALKHENVHFYSARQQILGRFAHVKPMESDEPASKRGRAESEESPVEVSVQLGLGGQNLALRAPSADLFTSLLTKIKWL